MRDSAVATPIARDDLLIPSDTPGIELHLRNKRPFAMRTFAPAKTVLLMHGATYSSGTLFDVPVGGRSFMDHLAGAGYDVWAVDVRGYGGSTKPPEMFEPPERNPPLGRTETGVRDLAAAIDFVRSHRGVAALNLFGMSWGGSVAGIHAAAHGDALVKLALLAPLWLTPGGARIDPGGPLGAYRKVPVRAGRQRWLDPVPADRRAALLPPGWFEAWADAALADDPEGAAEEPPTLRAGNGPLLDIREHWAVGRPLYRPEAITVPVLLVHAEWDADVSMESMRDLFDRLRGAPYRRWVEIGEGTHSVLMEMNRWQAFEAVRRFFDEEA